MPFLEIEPKVDHPDKVQQVAGVPTKFFIGSAEFNKTVEAINVLDQRIIANSIDKILVNNGFEIVGSNFVLNALSKWQISGNINQNPETIQKPIILSDVGLVRQVVVVMQSNNDIKLLNGLQVESMPTKPPIPDGVIVLTDFPVTDSSIGVPTLPIIGETFMKKVAFSSHEVKGFGFTTLIIDGDLGGFRFVGTNTTFESVFVYNIEELFDGKPFLIKNAQAVELTVKNMTGPGFKFLCPDGIDLTAQPGQTLPFEWRLNALNVWYLEYVGYVSETRFKTITGNISLDNSFNRAIVMVKASCTITVTTTLKKGFNCVFRTYAGVTATFVEASTVTFDAPKGKIMDAQKMATLFKDGTSNTYVLEGGLR